MHLFICLRGWGLLQRLASFYYMMGLHLEPIKGLFDTHTWMAGWASPSGGNLAHQDMGEKFRQWATCEAHFALRMKLL